jgi:NADH:ubiquinone reductase (non-electrogenic)
VIVETKDKGKEEIPMGLLVWAGVRIIPSEAKCFLLQIIQGNTLRPLTKKLMSYFPSTQTNKRGLTVDDHLRLIVPSDEPEQPGIGSDSIFALGDCVFGPYAPTAQVASQQGAYLARTLDALAKARGLQARLSDGSTIDQNEKAKVQKQISRIERGEKPFHYSHQGSLAYIGSDKAIADLPFPWLHGNVSVLISSRAPIYELTASPPLDLVRWSIDVPILAQCLPFESLFAAKSSPSWYRLDQNQNLWKAGNTTRA